MHVRASFQARGFCVVSGWETFKDWGACGEARGSLLILKTPTNLSRIGGCSKPRGEDGVVYRVPRWRTIIDRSPSTKNKVGGQQRQKGDSGWENSKSPSALNH